MWMHSLTALSIQHGHRRTGIGLLGDQTKLSVLYHMATLTESHDSQYTTSSQRSRILALSTTSAYCVHA